MFIVAPVFSNKNQIDNKVNSQPMTNSHQNPQINDYQLLKFESQQILVLEKKSRRLFQYYELQGQKRIDDLYGNFFHQTLVTPVIINRVILYPKYYSNLQALLKTRKSCNNRVPFTSEELGNTFFPILKCLKAMQQRKLTHGCICPRSVLVSEEGEIKLRDSIISNKESKSYYDQTNEISSVDDFKALGLIMLECATLSQQDCINEPLAMLSVKRLASTYRKQFILALIILLKKQETYFSKLQQLLSEENCQLDSGIQKEYLELIGKAQTPEPPDNRSSCFQSIKILNVPSQQIRVEPDQKAETQRSSKKFVINTPTKKLVRLQNYQNKKFSQQLKKKQQKQKVSKIKERSNGIANQLASKKFQQTVFRGTKVSFGIKNIVLGNQNSHSRKVSIDYSKFGSPNKKGIRFLSKKK